MTSRTPARRTPARRTLRGVGAGLLAGVTLVSLAQPAPAAAPSPTSARQAASFSDAAGDIDHGADLRRVRVVNNRQVRVRVVHADLRPSFRSGSSLSIYLDTDRSEAGPEFALVAGTYRGSDYALVRTNRWRLPRGGEPMRCSYAMSVDYATETADVRIARRCLDFPQGIRVAVSTAGEQPDGDTVVDWLGRRRQLTRWISRG